MAGILLTLHGLLRHGLRAVYPNFRQGGISLGFYRPIDGVVTAVAPAVRPCGGRLICPFPSPTGRCHLLLTGVPESQ